MMVISPDEGGMGRAIYMANVLGTDMGMFMTADRRNEQARPPRTASCGSGGRALWEGWEREISS